MASSLMPPVIAGTALAASLAYLSAKTSLLYDWQQLAAIAKFTAHAKERIKQDRVNIFYLLEDKALSERTANNIFLVYEGREWTYRQVYETAMKYGQWFKNLGVKSKDIVATDFMNSDRFILVFLGLWSIGAYPAFINYNLTGNPLLHCLKACTANLLLVDEEVRPKVSSDVLSAISSPQFNNGKGSMRVVYMGDREEQEIMSLPPIREPDACRRGVGRYEMATLIFTSGTTGLPKAAVISWEKCFNAGGFFANWLGIKVEDRFYTCMPLYHGTAFLLAFNPTLNRGSTLVIGHRFSNRTFWQEVRATESTIIQYVGETCRYLLAAPPQIDPETGENLDRKHKVRMAMGNGLRPDIWEKFKDRFNIDTITEFYAATESAIVLGNLSRNDFARGATGRNGFFMKWIQGGLVAVVKVDLETESPWRNPRTGLCKRVRDGDPGELMFKLESKTIESRFQGYFGDEAATEKKIVRDVLNKGDAYLRSGDIMRWDSDGRWWFIDRIGDTFRWKSENVATSEVAEALGVHPSISEANVYGVALPHHDGRAGCACVVLATDVTVTPETLASLAQHNKNNLPKYAVPLFLRVTKTMTTTGTNKQQKHVLRAEGVDPAVVGQSGDRLYWLRPGAAAYEKFGPKEWANMEAGQVKL